MRIYDAVVVGSGPTGGYAAKAMSEAGLRVIVLDAGPARWQSEALFLLASTSRRLGYRIEEDPAAVSRQRVQSSCYAWPNHPHAFVDDLDCPYTTDPDRPFAWIRSRQSGGRMVVRGHGLQFYRFSDLEFRCGERDGASVSWPISYDDLVPYYEQIEGWMRLAGSHDGIAHLPDSLLTYETTLNPGERLLKAGLERTWRDRRLIPCRTAAPPMPIVDALRTGRCIVRSNAIVSRVLTNGQTGKAAGVEFVDRVTERVREVAARIVVLCASAIESARLLLLSATRQHPAGLANASGAVGHYLMDHVHLGGIAANLPLRQDDRREERSWAYIPRFRNICGASSEFVRGYGIQVFTERDQCGLTAFGEMLPLHANRVELDSEQKDRWGIPVPQVTCVHRENEVAMGRDQMASCREILESAGFDVWRFARDVSIPGLAMHEVGTARMGADPRTSVLNSFCQSWDVDNLFVMDGSCFVSQGAQNPTLTMMAIAARSCDYLIDACRRGDI